MEQSTCLEVHRYVGQRPCLVAHGGRSDPGSHRDSQLVDRRKEEGSTTGHYQCNVAEIPTQATLYLTATTIHACGSYASSNLMDF